MLSFTKLSAAASVAVSAGAWGKHSLGVTGFPSQLQGNKTEAAPNFSSEELEYMTLVPNQKQMIFQTHIQ